MGTAALVAGERVIDFRIDSMVSSVMRLSPNPRPACIIRQITFSWISNSISECFLCQYYDDPEILWLLMGYYWQKKKSFDVDIGGYLKGAKDTARWRFHRIF
ncbi:hypothetical protein I7I50_03812 [Histoplasma capsulatum G186AR]|uniref:Uncharacterized protein n=1 Tax=Ajellomyces capsulatus TaxID=5037 RepID=A0A8H8CYJ5_AJECA|nr:hypothetical protein I7I52_04720 [Histoplasma capsulatum]QSS74868.1 hypothetical protein I7I50_03812 [Histoplasma capsulatum G186AR]